MFYKTHQEKETLTITFLNQWKQVNVSEMIKKLLPLIQESKKVIFLMDQDVVWDTSLLAVIYGLINRFPQKEFLIEKLPKNIQRLIQLSLSDHRNPSHTPSAEFPFLDRVGQYVLTLWGSLNRGLDFISDVFKSLGRFFQRKAVYRSIDFYSVLDDCAPKAVGIVCLISAMVGLILAFVGAIQLKSFGVQIYISSLVTIGMTRIMGAIMIGIIMAGRTGASYAATIGTMQVNEELDALKTMGISKYDFLILPRLGALVFSMPFLVVLADFMGMLGGAFVGVCLLNLAPEEYLQFSIDAFNITDFIIGILHGIVFGFVISLCGCYFGVKCGRDSGSVGLATTQAVVYSIVWMIVMTGILTLIFEVLGI